MMLNLTVLQGQGKGRVLQFTGRQPVIVGRQGPGLQLRDRKVSRQHAKLNYENNTWVLRDLGSSNGTFVNGQRITTLTELEEGDHIALGNFVFVVGLLSPQPQAQPQVHLPALDETNLVDVQDMDHVMLSPQIPTSDEPKTNDDLLHVESVAHPPRDEQPQIVPPPQESKHESIFDSDTPVESAVAHEENDADVSPTSELPEEKPFTVGQLHETSPEPCEEVETAEVETAETEAEDSQSKTQAPAPETEAGIFQIESEISEIEAKIKASWGDIETEEPFISQEQPANILEGLNDEPDPPVVEKEIESEPPTNETPSNLIDAMLSAPLDKPRDEASVPSCDAEVNEVAEPLFGPLTDDEPLEDAPTDSLSLHDTLIEPAAAKTSAEATDEVEQVEVAAEEDVVEPPASDPPSDPPISIALDDSEETAPPTSPPSEDDALQPPRRLDEASKSPRLVWPISIALLLLIGSGGTGIFLTLGKTPPEVFPEVSTTPSTKIFPKVSTTASTTAPPQAQSAILPGELPEGAFDDLPLLVEDTETPQSKPPTIQTTLAPPAPIRESPPVALIPVPEQEQEQEPELELVLEPVVPEPQPVAAPPVEPPTPTLLLNQHAVAYLIDASGSSLDIFPQTLTWLSDDLRQLDPKLSYTVIFFRADEAIEVPPAGMKDASDRTLNRQVRKWIDWEQGNVLPTGRSDPRAAIDLALRYHVGQIVILSDGHVGKRLTDEQMDQYMTQLDEQIGEQTFAIHAVQFFYPKVEGLLSRLTDRYPGLSKFIGPDDSDEDLPVLPLEPAATTP